MQEFKPETAKAAHLLSTLGEPGYRPKKIQKFYKASSEHEMAARMGADKTDMEAAGFTLVRRIEKIGRNAPCPCGSGRKFKRCCILKAS